MNYGLIAIYIAVMAGVTYLPRMVPLAVFRKKIRNVFIQSFLIYMPYGVLAAMVFPAVFTSTANLVSALCGLVVAVLFSYRRLGLLPVALSATAAVFIAERLLPLLGL